MRVKFSYILYGVLVTCALVILLALLFPQIGQSVWADDLVSSTAFIAVFIIIYLFSKKLKH